MLRIKVRRTKYEGRKRQPKDFVLGTSYFVLQTKKPRSLWGFRAYWIRFVNRSRPLTPEAGNNNHDLADDWLKISDASRAGENRVIGAVGHGREPAITF